MLRLFSYWDHQTPRHLYNKINNFGNNKTLRQNNSLAKLCYLIIPGVWRDVWVGKDSPRYASPVGVARGDSAGHARQPQGRQPTVTLRFTPLHGTFYGG